MQKTIELSTAEAEYYSASEIAVEIIYLCNLIRNVGLPQEDDTPVYEDNTACIEWGNHVIGGRERAKHIDIRKHFAHEVIQNRHMRLIRVPTDEQSADIFTKEPPEGEKNMTTIQLGIVLECLQRLSHVGPSEGCLTVLQDEGPP